MRIQEAARKAKRAIGMLKDAVDRGRVRAMLFRGIRRVHLNDVLSYVNRWPKDCITVPEAARRAQVNASLMNHAIAKGRIRAKLIGSKYAVRLCDVQAYLGRWPKGRLSIPVAARKAKVARELLYYRIQTGKLPSVRVGVHHAVRWKDVLAAVRATAKA